MRTTGLFLCHKTKKRQYADGPQAKAELKRIQERPQTAKTPSRAYECPHCGYWHLTSLTDATARFPAAPWHQIVGVAGQPIERPSERKDVLAVMRTDRSLIGARVDEGVVLDLAYTTAGTPASAVDLYERLKARREQMGWEQFTRLVVSRWPAQTPDGMLARSVFTSRPGRASPTRLTDPIPVSETTHSGPRTFVRDRLQWSHAADAAGPSRPYTGAHPPITLSEKRQETPASGRWLRALGSGSQTRPVKEVLSMASERHSTRTARDCKASERIIWHCQHCGQPTEDGWLAITRRDIRRLTTSRATTGTWRTWCRQCATATHGTIQAFRDGHDHIHLAVLATVEHIDTETLRRASTWPSTWMGRTNWAEITTVGGHTEGAAAA